MATTAITPQSFDELVSHYWQYVFGLFQKLGVTRDTEDSVQDFFEKMHKRNVLAMYDPEHTVTHQGKPVKCSFRALLAGQAALYARNYRERQEARDRREVLASADQAEDGPGWAAALAGTWMDDYPSLADDSAALSRIRTWLALQPPAAPAEPDLLALFDELVREAESGEVSPASAGKALGISAKAARAGMAELQAALDRRHEPPPQVSWTVGGVPLTPELVREAICVLESSSSIMVLQPLRKAGHPLAGAEAGWYHPFSAEERKAYPHLEIDPNTHKKPAGHVKLAVVHRLRRMLSEAASSAADSSVISAGSGSNPEPEVLAEGLAADEVLVPPAAAELLEAELWRLGADAEAVDRCMGLAAMVGAG